MSIIRAAVISGRLCCLYVVISVVVFNFKISDREEYYFPVVTVIFLFFIIVINDADWVNKEYKKFL